jgi:acid phosphatase type 7
MLRRMKKWPGIAALLIPLWTTPVFSTDLYDPVALFLTWQQDPATTMTIDWHTVDEQRPVEIDYRIKGDEAWMSSFGASHDFPHSRRTINRVELTGLEPDTKYEFRFGPGSKAYFFRTMPDKLTRPLRIAIGGDTMHHQAFFEETNRQVLKYDPDFVYIGGDIAYADALPPDQQGIRADPQTRGRVTGTRPGPGEGDNLWYHWFDGYKNTLITENGRVIPMVLTIGNHEVLGSYVYRMDNYQATDDFRFEQAPYFFSLFAMPGQPGYNVLDFGDYMSLVILDSDHTNPIDGEQSDWLEQVLSERRHVPHVFPKYHVPGFPSVREVDGRIQTRVREHWVPLFEEYNVRLVFENHDHAYKRTHPIRNGEISSNGVVYVGDGSWGTVPRALGGREMAVSYRFSDGIESPDENPYGEEYWYIHTAKSVMHFILLTIDGPHQHMLMIDSKGNIFDEYPESPYRSNLAR